MARIHFVKSAQQRYRQVPVIDPETGQQKVTPVMRRNGEQKTNKHGRPTVQRQTVADKSQPLSMPTCGKCHKTIEVGSSYRWVKVKSGPYGGRTMYRCGECPTWKQSELTSSKMAGIYAMQEMVDEQIGSCESVDDLRSLAEAAAEMVREVAEEYRESQQNMVDGFGHDTVISDELGEKADSLDSWADDIEQLDFEEFEGDDLDEEDEEPAEPEREEGESVEDFDDRYTAWEDAHAEWESRQAERDDAEEARDQWLDDQRNLLTDEAYNCPI